jgi:uncharacterized RDD family membrane protein YckC
MTRVMPDGPVQLAGFWIRLVAVLLDGLISLAFAVPFLIGIVVVLVAGPKRRTTCSYADGTPYACDVPAGGPIALAVLIGIVGVVAYVVWYQGVLPGRGATPGKRVAGLRIVDSRSGRPIGTGRALGRYLFATFISGQICYLGYLWNLWDRDKQTWHDKVVSSYVVRAR